MAGNSDDTESPDVGGSQPAKPAGPRVKTFTCPKCGGTCEIRCPGQTLSVVCSSCKSVIDVSDGNYQILQKYMSKLGPMPPKIPLGKRGKLKGELWEVIGFMVRADVSSKYHWDEYLLFNPKHGFRWLTEAGGHWNFVTPIKEKPTITGSPQDKRASGGERAEYKDKSFRLYYRGDAEIWHVLGEFYWKVIVESRVKMADYVCPPQMLSMEKDDKEVNWSVSDYTYPQEITEAFGVTNLVRSYTIAPNQPSPNAANWNKLKYAWGIFLMVLTICQCAHVVMSPSQVAFANGYSFMSNDKKPDITTAVFKVERGPGNLKVGFTADVDNSWFYVAGDLVNDTTGNSYSFERSCEYYHGYDGGEYWSEGGTSNSITFSNIPDGNYYLNMDTESGDFKQGNTEHAFSLSVVRGVPTWGNYWWALFFISFLPACAWFMARSDETSRWRDSDYNPYFVSTDNS